MSLWRAVVLPSDGPALRCHAQRRQHKHHDRPKRLARTRFPCNPNRCRLAAPVPRVKEHPVCARSSVGSVPKLRAGSRQGIVKPSGLRARDHRGLVSSARSTPARESEIYPAECSILDHKSVRETVVSTNTLEGSCGLRSHDRLRPRTRASPF